MELKRNDKKIVKAQILVSLIFWCCLFAVYTGLAIYFFFKRNSNIVLYYSLLGSIGFLLLGLLALLIVFPYLSYKNYRYSIDQDKIVCIKGVIFINKDIVPVKRVQHIEIIRGPIMRAYGLSSIAIHTAGSLMILTGLDKQIAEEELALIKQVLDKKLDNV